MPKTPLASFELLPCQLDRLADRLRLVGPRLAAREGEQPQELLRAIWGDSAYRDPRAIDVHIRHLREKLEPEPDKPRYILTVRGAGYRLRGP